MGLDMYLMGRVSTYKSWGEAPSEAPSTKERNAALRAAKAVGLTEVSDNIDTITVSREVAYWRKANQIHKWFVDNVQDGEDNCREYYVPREKLVELRALCQRVLDESQIAKGKVVNGYTYDGDKRVPIMEDGETITNPDVAEALLPTVSGFFFGGTEYDSYYLSDIKNTVEQLDKVLALPEDIEFYYQSSW